MKPLWKFLVIFGCIAAIAQADPGSDGGNEGPHGGDPNEQKWSIDADEVLLLVREKEGHYGLTDIEVNVLETTIKNTYLAAEDHVFVVGPDGKIHEKASSNQAGNPPVIKISRTLYPGLVRPERLGHVFHEYLGIMGKELDEYTYSKRLRIDLEAGARAPEDQLSHLLYQAYTSNSREGYSWSQVLQICETQKQMHQAEFFMVYCVFHDKTWVEIRDTVGFYSDYQFMGYTTTKSSAGVGVAGVTRSMGLAGAATSSNSTQTPVVQEVKVPYHDTDYKNVSVYGIRVFGVGKKDRNLPWKKVYSSLDVAPGVFVDTYTTEKDALIACNSFIIHADDTEFKYLNARCRIKKDSGISASEPYYYEVITQNPFVK